MTKKGDIIVIVASLFVLYFAGFVSANFVCGTVYNSDNSSAVSLSWLHVKVYYPENKSSFTQCQVSPENSRYCCDPNDIKGASWSIGKNISAELNEQGFTLSTLSLISSGKGFDLFPNLPVSKILEVKEPNSSFYLGASSVHVSAKINSQYNNLGYKLTNNNLVVEDRIYCQNCTSADFNITNLSFGQYSLFMTAYNPNSNYTENENFTILQYLNLNRTISCDGCQGLRIPASAQNVTINLFLNASDSIAGTLTDRFPADWMYNGNLQIDEATDSHNSISWKVSGNNIVESYVLIPPKNLFNYNYAFQSIFESFVSPTDSVLLTKFGFIYFLSLPKTYLQNVRAVNIFKTLSATISNPAILMPVGLDVSEIAIFPKNQEKNVLSFVKSSQNIKLNESKSNFIVWSSIDNSNIDKLFMKFQLSKTALKNKNVSLFYYDYSNDAWIRYELQKTGEDKRYSYYQSFTNKTGVYSIL